MEIEDKIEAEITPSLTDMGYEVVRVSLIGGDVKTIQVMAERRDRQSMTLDDVTKVSRTVSALMDIMDPFAGRWTLEVSSPGIDRPLFKVADYERFLGYEAKVETIKDIDGRKRFKGRLMNVSDDLKNIVMNVDGTDVSLPFDNIHKAKLILTDDLLRADMKKH